ncbi:MULTISPECIES: A/G-specific adenine glycosylase [unclassified Leisingera]|uniref:A/G-specific adenine glycosylase n=1 Tax=unclassified Leisingera TaxID=2614906 RepID=UPI000303048A|nr:MULTISPECIES: A/G-specific adenine glycosylase [unclassified Leisingera]KIC22172.1 adenine glycosylase [Leisingera sp. ANG-S3]KIC53646.1 adenine glycosylase [Leisingera sp. ANG-S]KID07239.1 adenine glycosylase [Leisingera sp. ANG1]
MRDLKSDSATMSEELLAWYDVHAREMPWRVGPASRAAGIRPDPYRIWLSEVMLQQTTVAAVREYFLRFTSRWPTVLDLAAAEDTDVMSEWAGLGYYARARNLLKCARAVAQDHGGSFPDSYEGLLKLPGIGPYTAAAIASIAFDRAETVLDGNVERVMARVHDIHDPLPGAKPVLKDRAAELTPVQRPGDYAQAVMDLGATICTPRNPACGICPWRGPCAARVAGTAAELPKKTPKKPKPTRQGIVYLAESADGTWLLERRPDKGLLGGMLGWPGSDWSDAPVPNPPFEADWQELAGEVRHTFTHFHLILRIMTAELPGGFNQSAEQELISRHHFRPSSLPTVMRKAFDLYKGR